jgi:hypothetical protein
MKRQTKGCAVVRGQGNGQTGSVEKSSKRKGRRKAERSTTRSSTARGSTIPLWVLTETIGESAECRHFPSRFAAELDCDRPSLRHVFDRVHHRDIRPAARPTSGRVFRVVEIDWQQYPVMVAGLARLKAGRGKPAVGFADHATILRKIRSETGLRESKILADVKKCVAKGCTLDCRAPRHFLDLPAVLMIGETQQSAEVADYTDRATAMKAAADFNRRQIIAEGEIPERWAIVAEVGEPIEKAGSASLTFSGGIGIEDRSTYRPVRVVRPTEAEVAQHGQWPAAAV